MLNHTSMRFPIILFLSIVLPSGPAGCVHPDRLSLLPPPPSEEQRAAFGTIGMVAADYAPEAKMDRPAKGRLSGAGKGAGEGAAVGATIGLTIGLFSPASPWIFVTATAGMVAGSIIGIIPGAIHGAATAPSPEEVEQAESALKAALSDLQLHEIVSDGVVQAARDLNRRQVVLPPDQGPVAPGEAVSYRPLAENGTDTILEIRGPVVRLRAELGTDPPMALFMTLRARLIRTADDETLYEGRVEYRSEKHRFSEWAADGASLFREAVARGCWSLAGRVVEEIFMLYPRPASGLRPEYPEARPNFEVDTLQPVFRWEPFPGEYDTGLEMDRIGHVTYDLRIFRAEEEEFVRLASTLTPDYPAQVVYQRDGLAGPSHQIETPLPPSTRYYWTIRARFELDGHPRVTQWGLAWSPVTRREWGGIGIHGDRTMGRVPRNPNPYFYRFRTPSKPR